MTATINRQRRLLLGGLAATPCLAAFHSSLAAGSDLETHPISDRLSLITGAGGNVVLFRGSDGITLIDSGSPRHTAALVQTINGIAGTTPVTTLFNTHWHDEHSGGNEALHAMGARIIAHENTKLWLTADFEVHWRNTSHKPRPAEALPDVTFYSDGQMDLGNETVHYYHVHQAHTDGDIYLHFPESNVIVAGGLLSNYRYPITDIATGGWLGGLMRANADMLELADQATVIVPDHGPALGKADLQAQYDMLTEVYEAMKGLMQQGYSGHDMLAEANVTEKFDAVWGDPTEFILETYRGLWAHTSDMGGFI